MEFDKKVKSVSIPTYKEVIINKFIMTKPVKIIKTDEIIDVKWISCEYYDVNLGFLYPETDKKTANIL